MMPSKQGLIIVIIIITIILRNTISGFYQKGLAAYGKIV